MEESKYPRHKIIAVYGNAVMPGKTEYAINLSVALAKVAKKKVLFVDIAKPFGVAEKLLRVSKEPEEDNISTLDIGIDILSLKRVQKTCLERIKDNYHYIIINFPVDIDESAYEMFFCSNEIHFFTTSTKEDLRSGHNFLNDLIERNLKEIHAKLKVVVNRLVIFDRLSLEEISWLLKRDVWAALPEPGILDAPIDSEGRPIVLRTEGSAYSSAIFRIAKKESGLLVGLALGSGAAFGLAHIGVLRVLEKNKIPIDILSGSSIGAIIAAMWGLGLSSDKIERITRKIESRFSIIKLLDFTMPISGILSGRRMKRLLRSILGEKTFEDLKIPVKIMVYDLANRETFAIEKGKLVDAVYMSMAVPGIFKPKVERERVIVDGGVSDPVPVDILLKKEARKIIAVNVLPGPEDIHKRNRLIKRKLEKEEVLLQSAPFYVKYGLLAKRFFRNVFSPNIFDVIMTSMQSIEYILAENSCKKADVVLRPVFSEATSIDFRFLKEFIKKGEEETLQNIERIKELTQGKTPWETKA